MLMSKAAQGLLLSAVALQATAMTIAGKPDMMIRSEKNDGLTDLVTWDEHSLFVRGERIFFYSGEVHPFRIPVPGLWLDVFQKIKALGYNGVSFYVDWALLEGKQGDFSAEGIFAFEPFFEAAQKAGIYLLARPGPYIQAEVSGGGFPGWMQRNPGLLRTREPAYEHATDNYVSKISAIIAKAQITNGGPVILLQPENEYSQGVVPEFPDPVYFSYVEKQYRDGGIVVPLIFNDARPQGYFAPGPPRQPAAVDIYGYDGYPLGFDCAHPTTWPAGSLETNYYQIHEKQSSANPNAIFEFQGGSFDGWGGSGYESCAALLNHEFERVFYKNNFAAGVTMFNIYMTYGGTNWGNLGVPFDYTSYDYGAVIAEDRTVTREKYSEAKLEANFVQASPSLLTAAVETSGKGDYTNNTDLYTSALYSDTRNSSAARYFVVRHDDFQSLDTTQYSITLPTAQGDITIPQAGGKLSLHGRDSKWHVANYDVGGKTLLYSTAEIFTWKRYGNRRVLVVYGGPGETHELAIVKGGKPYTVEGSGVRTSNKNGNTILNFDTSSERRIVDLGCSKICDIAPWIYPWVYNKDCASTCELSVYILDRNSAYNYWVLDQPNDETTENYFSQKLFPSAPIVKAGYLMRTVEVKGNTITLTGDVNATTPIEIIGANRGTKKVTFNGKDLKFHENSVTGAVTATVTYNEPKFSIPDLSKIGWKVLDTVPEIQNGYDDSSWTKADLTYTNNTNRNITTPTSLYASDYGYNAGYMVYRGHFTANQSNAQFNLSTAGGVAFANSIWLNDSFIGGLDYFVGTTFDGYYTLPVQEGENYILTILIDNTGLNYNSAAGDSDMKNPRGILDYSLQGSPKSAITWKLTGNLGGETYRDRSRGPLNEGGLYAERQGYHLPGAPTATWNTSTSGPMEGFSSAGVHFYATNVTLDLPQGYDIPLSLVFGDKPIPNGPGAYRCQIWVNGFQFGKYSHNIGPQQSFPVPEGVWNYQGDNYVAVSLWALDKTGASVSSLKIVAGHPVQSGYGEVKMAPVDGWMKREGAY